MCLWLGANVMLEYPRSEAIELLQKDMHGESMKMNIGSGSVQS